MKKLAVMKRVSLNIQSAFLILFSFHMIHFLINMIKKCDGIMTVSYTHLDVYKRQMGGNEKAAVLSGIKTKKVLFWTFVNMAVLSAVAGIVYTLSLIHI